MEIETDICRDDTFQNCTLTYSNSVIENSNIIQRFENLQPRVQFRKKPSNNKTLLKLKTFKLPDIFQYQPKAFKKQKKLDNHLSFKRLHSFTDRVPRKQEDKKMSPFGSLIIQRKQTRRIDCRKLNYSPFVKIAC